jgi:hypothetical protein
MPDRHDVNPSVPPFPSNAFSPDFLRRLDERDEPITSAEADMAGPWSVEPLAGRGFGLFRAGERPPRGFPPYALFPDRFLALLAAAVLPGTGREPLLHLGLDAGPDGYDVRLDDGTVVGHLGQFDEALIGGMNVAVALVRSPLALSLVLEAAGAVALERCGAILAEYAAGAEMGAGV